MTTILSTRCDVHLTFLIDHGPIKDYGPIRLKLRGHSAVYIVYIVRELQMRGK